MVDLNVILNITPCLRGIEYNEDEFKIKLFYPSNLKPFFDEIDLKYQDLDTSYNNTCVDFKEKFFYSEIIFGKNLLSLFFEDLDDIFNRYKNNIKKELIFKAQLQNMNESLEDLVNNSTLVLNADIIQEIINVNTFDYEEDVKNGWSELMSVMENDDISQENDDIESMKEPTVNYDLNNSQYIVQESDDDNEGETYYLPQSALDDDYDEFNPPEGYFSEE